MGRARAHIILSACPHGRGTTWGTLTCYGGAAIGGRSEPNQKGLQREDTGRQERRPSNHQCGNEACQHACFLQPERGSLAAWSILRRPMR